MRALVCLLLFRPDQLFAGGMAVRFGPPSFGTGGPNPVSIPPSATDLGFSYVTNAGTEYNAAATGVSVARRSKTRSVFYTSLGFGLAWSANGGGLGPYAAFGLELGCGGWVGCFSTEFTQALGIGFGRHLASPTALRMGLMKWF